MKDWEPKYITTTVEPVTVLQSNEGVKMKRFEPEIQYEPYDSSPHAGMDELPNAEYVKHSDVQNAFNTLLEHPAILRFSSEYYAIQEIMILNGFEVKE